MKLVDSKNLGYTKNGSQAVQFPLNNPAFDAAESDIDLSLPAGGGKNLYKYCVPEPEQKPLNFVVGIEKAIARMLFHSTSIECENYGGWGFDLDGNFYADYYGGSVQEFNDVKSLSHRDFGKHRRQIFKIGTDKKLSAFALDEKGAKSKLCLKTNSYNASHTSSGVIYALMTYLIASVETNKIDNHTPGYDVAKTLYCHYKACVDAILAGDLNSLVVADRNLDADIYTILAKDSYIKKKFAFNSLNLSLYDKDEFDLLEETNFDLTESWGNSSLLKGDKSLNRTGGYKKATKKKFVKDYLGKFILDPIRVLTDEEQRLVPCLDSYVMNNEILNKAKLICNSTNMTRKMRNVLMVGEAGSGKSSAAAILAQLLNLPYVFYTFNPDTILSDLYVNVLPNNKVVTKDEFKSLSEELIDCTSINYDAAGQYEKLTGIKKDDATEGDCIAAIIEKQYALLNKSSDYMYVESPLVQAFRNGYVCELQEINVCSKPGVLSGINAALDDLATIQLPTGEIVKRHPDTVIIMTANEGYEGTRAINQAVKSRCSLVGTFKLPEDNDLIEMVKLKSELEDDKLIKQLIKVMHGIRKKLEETGANDGVCGLRELLDWASATKILEDPYEAALNTIIPKATSDPDVQPELVICLETQFQQREEFDF